jgi:hypothetical protein
MASCHANDFGGAECVEAIDEGNPDLDFGVLAVGVSCGDALTEGLEAAHPLPGNGLPANHERVRLDPASDVVSGPPLPERPAIVASGAQGLVSRNCSRAIFLPRPSVLADWYDRRGLPVDPFRACKHALPGSGWRCGSGGCHKGGCHGWSYDSLKHLGDDDAPRKRAILASA